MKKGVFLLVLALLFICFTEPIFGQGCSQCKMLSTQGAEITEIDEASFGSNINYGILYLMIIPYLLLMFLFRKQIKGVFLHLMKK